MWDLPTADEINQRVREIERGHEREPLGPPKEDRPTGGGDDKGPLIALIAFYLLVYVIPVILGKNFDWPGVVVWFGGLALIGLCVGSYFIVQEALERRATRKTVERLLALEPRRSWREWALPAPESYVLLRGVTKVKGDAFKLGLLQMIAMGVLAPDGSETPEGGDGETTLRRGPAPADALAGSLVPIFRLWAASAEDQVGEGHATVGALALRARQEHGSLDRFVDQVVVPELVKAGLYAEYLMVLTPAGQGTLADLESRMAGVLREMQVRRGSWVEKELRKALLAAVLAVALGQRRPPEEAELQLVGNQVEQAAAVAAAPHETHGPAQTGFGQHMWSDWRTFDNFDRCFRTVDSQVDSGCASGDGSGSDGGSDGGGGDGGGGDCGGGD